MFYIYITHIYDTFMHNITIIMSKKSGAKSYVTQSSSYCYVIYFIAYNIVITHV